MVVELASAWTFAELRMAIARLKNLPPEPQRKRFELIIVATNHQQVPPEAMEFPIILRQETWVTESDAFITQLVERLRESAPQGEAVRGAEARRLLAAREYRAAVIAAMTHLESTLRERLDKRPWPDVRRPMTLRSLAELAAEQNLISHVARDSIDKWSRIRNSAVHTTQPVSARDAREIVDGVERLLSGVG